MWLKQPIKRANGDTVTRYVNQKTFQTKSISDFEKLILEGLAQKEEQKEKEILEQREKDTPFVQYKDAEGKVWTAPGVRNDEGQVVPRDIYKQPNERGGEDQFADFLGMDGQKRSFRPEDLKGMKYVVNEDIPSELLSAQQQEGVYKQQVEAPPPPEPPPPPPPEAPPPEPVASTTEPAVAQPAPEASPDIQVEDSDVGQVSVPPEGGRRDYPPRQPRAIVDLSPEIKQLSENNGINVEEWSETDQAELADYDQTLAHIDKLLSDPEASDEDRAEALKAFRDTVAFVGDLLPDQMQAYRDAIKNFKPYTSMQARAQRAAEKALEKAMTALENDVDDVHMTPTEMLHAGGALRAYAVWKYSGLPSKELHEIDTMVLDARGRAKKQPLDTMNKALDLLAKTAMPLKNTHANALLGNILGLINLRKEALGLLKGQLTDDKLKGYLDLRNKVIDSKMRHKRLTQRQKFKEAEAEGKQAVSAAKGAIEGKTKQAESQNVEAEAREDYGWKTVGETREDQKVRSEAQWRNVQIQNKKADRKLSAAIATANNRAATARTRSSNETRLAIANNRAKMKKLDQDIELYKHDKLREDKKADRELQAGRYKNEQAHRDRSFQLELRKERATYQRDLHDVQNKYYDYELKRSKAMRDSQFKDVREWYLKEMVRLKGKGSSDMSNDDIMGMIGRTADRQFLERIQNMSPEDKGRFFNQLRNLWGLDEQGMNLLIREMNLVDDIAKTYYDPEQARQKYNQASSAVNLLRQGSMPTDINSAAANLRLIVGDRGNIAVAEQQMVIPANLRNVLDRVQSFFTSTSQSLQTGGRNWTQPLREQFAKSFEIIIGAIQRDDFTRVRDFIDSAAVPTVIEGKHQTLGIQSKQQVLQRFITDLNQGNYLSRTQNEQIRDMMRSLNMDMSLLRTDSIKDLPHVKGRLDNERRRRGVRSLGQDQGLGQSRKRSKAYQDVTGVKNTDF